MFYPDYPNLEFVLRLLVATLLGGVVGLERELRAKEAGIRTHFLVALGSALLMIISQYGFSEAPGRAADPSRLAAQIVSGIGFLCAGTIISAGRLSKASPQLPACEEPPVSEWQPAAR